MVKSCEINSYQTRLIKTANDAVGRTPAAKTQTKTMNMNGFETRDDPTHQFGANRDVDRSNPYGYDVKSVQNK